MGESDIWHGAIEHGAREMNTRNDGVALDEKGFSGHTLSRTVERKHEGGQAGSRMDTKREQQAKRVPGDSNAIRVESWSSDMVDRWRDPSTGGVTPFFRLASSWF